MDTALTGTPQARIGIIGGSGTYQLPGAAVLATSTLTPRTGRRLVP